MGKRLGEHVSDLIMNTDGELVEVVSPYSRAMRTMFWAIFAYIRVVQGGPCYNHRLP